jgi:hypothetical protein
MILFKTQLGEIFSVALNRNSIILAAQEIQKLPKFAEDEKIQRLKFSGKWVSGLLRRASMSRRRITTSKMGIATNFDISHIQKAIPGHQHVYNADETGIFISSQSNYLYMDQRGRRAVSIQPESKMRLTAMLCLRDDGWIAPPFLIIRNTLSCPNQSGSRVIHSLHKRDPFTEANGWEMLMWNETLLVKGIVTQFNFPYLRQTSTGVVITANSKAWMTSCLMVMWTQLIVRFFEPGLLVMDNVSMHKTEIVMKALNESPCHPVYLPTYSTAVLQPCDLVLNGKIKAGIRKLRSAELLTALKSWKLDYAQKFIAGLPTEEFRAPNPKLLATLPGLLEILNDLKNNLKFVDSIKKCFIRCGFSTKAKAINEETEDDEAENGVVETVETVRDLIDNVRVEPLQEEDEEL